MKYTADEFLKGCAAVTAALLISALILLLYTSCGNFPNLFYIKHLTAEMCSTGAVVLIVATIGWAVINDLPKR